MEVKLGPHGILVEKGELKERKLKSGIIIPRQVKQVKPKSKVIAVGPGTKQRPMEAKVGDTITYSGIAGREVEIDGKEYLLIDSDNCLYID